MLSWCRCLLFSGRTANSLHYLLRPRQGVFFDEAIAPKLGPEAPLLPLYRALAFNCNVVNLQIGDSHTANDSFSAGCASCSRRDSVTPVSAYCRRGCRVGGYRTGPLIGHTGGLVGRTAALTPMRPGHFGIAGLRQHAGGSGDDGLDCR